MKGRQVILGHLWGREAAALMVDGRIEDLLLDLTALTPLPPGAICRAVVDRLVKGQGGVFLRLPEGERGFLREARGLSEGQSLIVQVSGVAEDGKAIPVTQRVLFRGQTGIATPGAPGVNVSRRIRDELISLAEMAVQVMGDRAGRPELLVDAEMPWRAAWIDWADPAPDDIDETPGAFDSHGVTDAVEALLDPEFALPDGGFAVIEPTRAMVAVDVNTGRDTSAAAALKANITLARDLPRQLRLRGLGGQVVVDFAPIPKRDRGTLDQALRAAFRADGTETTLVGWTAMGLYELSRKRDRAPLGAIARLAASLEEDA